MIDVLTPTQRSYCMSRNRGKNTKPEMLLRRELWDRGLRYRTSTRTFGKPDIVFVGARIAVFVDGCFWHGCPDHSTSPRTNADFWRQKIDRNKKRDELVNQTLSRKGWQVIRIWEHQIKENLRCCADEVEAAVRSRSQ